MCGIVAYIGNKDVCPLLIEGLKRLDYRGYDSAGLVVLQNGKLHIRRAAGRISALEEKVDDSLCGAQIGVAHTRWATHGAPTEQNAHPHRDSSGKLALVHNGIIENYRVLRTIPRRPRRTHAQRHRIRKCWPSSSGISTKARLKRPCDARCVKCAARTALRWYTRTNRM